MPTDAAPAPAPAPAPAAPAPAPAPAAPAATPAPVPDRPSGPLMAVTGSTLVLAAAPARPQGLPSATRSGRAARAALTARAARTARPAGPYRRLFALPGTRGFTTGNLIARLPMGMFGISAVMMIAGQRGSYALAGAVVAAGLAATALVAPLTARLVDRHGQARSPYPPP